MISCSAHAAEAGVASIQSEQDSLVKSILAGRYRRTAGKQIFGEEFSEVVDAAEDRGKEDFRNLNISGKVVDIVRNFRRMNDSK